MIPQVVTVLGRVEAADLGVVDAHEHLLLRWEYGPTADPDLCLDDRAEAVAEAKAFGIAGGGTIIDAMPTGLGRDVEGLIEVSRRSGVHVVATCGYHKSAYYPVTHWARRYAPNVQVELLFAEIEEGIDRYDYAGPNVERSSARPGVLKIATSYNAISEFERRSVEVVAEVHRISGLPVITHTEQGTFAHQQLDLLEEYGVDASRVALSHLDRNPDHVLMQELASRGAYLIFDGVGRDDHRPLSAVTTVIRRLAETGFATSVLLGGDVARRSLRIRSGGPGVAGILTSHVAALRSAGCDDRTVGLFTETNPARWLTAAGDVRVDDDHRHGDGKHLPAPGPSTHESLR